MMQRRQGLDPLAKDRLTRTAENPQLEMRLKLVWEAGRRLIGAEMGRAMGESEL